MLLRKSVCPHTGVKKGKKIEKKKSRTHTQWFNKQAVDLKSIKLILFMSFFFFIYYRINFSTISKNMHAWFLSYRIKFHGLSITFKWPQQSGNLGQHCQFTSGWKRSARAASMAAGMTLSTMIIITIIVIATNFSASFSICMLLSELYMKAPAEFEVYVVCFDWKNGYWPCYL